MNTQALRKLSTEQLQSSVADYVHIHNLHRVNLLVLQSRSDPMSQQRAAEAEAYIVLHRIFVRCYLDELTRRGFNTAPVNDCENRVVVLTWP